MKCSPHMCQSGFPLSIGMVRPEGFDRLGSRGPRTRPPGSFVACRAPVRRAFPRYSLGGGSHSNPLEVALGKEWHAILDKSGRSWEETLSLP